MALSRPHGYDSFGWAVRRGDKRPVQLEDEVETMVQRLANTWKRQFPAADGYTVTTDSPAGRRHGVRLLVQRGDFQASVALETGRVSRALCRAPEMRIRMSGRAASQAMAQAEKEAERIVTRWNAGGATFGGLIFATICWLVIGVPGPALLGGLLMAVMLLVSLTAGASAGSFLGENRANQLRARARAAAAADAELTRDLQRWRALARQFSAEREVMVGGHRGLPFRAPPKQLAPGQAAATG